MGLGLGLGRGLGLGFWPSAVRTWLRLGLWFGFGFGFGLCVRVLRGARHEALERLEHGLAVLGVAVAQAAARDARAVARVHDVHGRVAQAVDLVRARVRVRVRVRVRG